MVLGHNSIEEASGHANSWTGNNQHISSELEQHDRVIPAPSQLSPPKMKIIIAGATGFVGNELVRQALRHKQISSVIALSRKPVDYEIAGGTPNLEQVLIEDYTQYSDVVKEQLADADACIWTVAITPTKSRLVPFEEVKRVCQDATLAGLEAMRQAWSNKPFRFIYTSGVAAERDPAKTPPTMPEYCRMRGDTETMVIDFAAKNKFEAACTRPGLIIKMADDDGTGTVMRGTLALPTIRLEELAAAMLQLTLGGFEREPLTNSDLVTVGRGSLETVN